MVIQLWDIQTHTDTYRHTNTYKHVQTRTNTHRYIRTANVVAVLHHDTETEVEAVGCVTVIEAVVYG